MSSGWLCCSSKRSPAKSGCCESPNLVLVGSGRWCLWSHLYWEEQHCVSPGGGLSLHPFCLGGSSPPHHTVPDSNSCCLLATGTAITSTNMALSCIAACPDCSSPIRSPNSRFATRAGPFNPTIWVHACWTCAGTARPALCSRTRTSLKTYGMHANLVRVCFFHAVSFELGLLGVW